MAKSTPKKDTQLLQFICPHCSKFQKLFASPNEPIQCKFCKKYNND